MRFRHELKYVLSNEQAFLLKNSFSKFLKYDINYKDGQYYISSLYLDTFDNEMLNESIEGLNDRTKYRIRFYNNDLTLIKVERKKTVGCLKNKVSFGIDKKEVNEYINNKSFNIDNNLVSEIKSLGLFPKIIINYDRIAFVNDVGNVRITFDTNIYVSNRIDHFFDKSYNSYRVLDKDKTILEVKYDDILPGFISDLLNKANIQRTSYSKYVMSMNKMELIRKEDN